MKWPFYRGGLRFCLVLIALAARESTVLSVAMGIPLISLGVALHVWAKGCLHQNREVTISGPYQFVRHPFYTANALVDAAIAIMSGWWLMVALLPFWWLAVYLPVIRKEEAYLAEAFPSSYPAYKRRVPALVPLRKPLPKTGPGFSWSNPNIACGKEFSRALHLLAYPLLFYIWTELRATGGSFFMDHHCLKLWGLYTHRAVCSGLATRTTSKTISAHFAAVPWQTGLPYRRGSCIRGDGHGYNSVRNGA